MQKRLLLLSLLCSILFSACTLDNSSHTATGHLIYSADDIVTEEDNNIEKQKDSKEVKEDVSGKDTKQPEVSSISFDNLSKKEVKKLKRDLRKLYADYFKLKVSEIKSKSVEDSLRQIADYGFIIKVDNKIQLNEQAILDLIDIFTENLQFNIEEEKKSGVN